MLKRYHINMTHEQTKTIREGLSKIAKCYESNYRDYITNLGTDRFGSEKFDARMKIVDRMIENWENLVIHFINLEYKSYKPVDNLDKVTRELKLNEWQCQMSGILALISSHWAWLAQEPRACSNMIRSYYLYKNSQDEALNNFSKLNVNF